MGGLWPFARPARIAPAPRPAAAAAFAPRLDVYQKDGNLVIQAELPGLTPEEVEITVEDGDLIIKGEKRAESEAKDKDYYRIERSSGEFYRRQPLPEGIKPEQITATLDHGVLEVSIPAPREAKSPAQRIPIARVALGNWQIKMISF
jgi:HSP20 family protein